MGNSSSKQEGPGRDQGPGGIPWSPYLIDTLETSDFVILVQFNPDQQWHRFKVLYNMFFLKMTLTCELQQDIDNSNL